MNKTDRLLYNLDQQFSREERLAVDDGVGNVLEIEAHFLSAPINRKKPSKLVAIIPGWGMSCYAFKEFAERLALASGEPVIIISLPGTGESSNPPVAWLKQADFTNEAAVALGAVEQLARSHGLAGVPLFLLGHSKGGFVAAQMAKQFPKAVSGLVLAHSAGFRKEKPLALALRYAKAAVRDAGTERFRKTTEKYLKNGLTATSRRELARQMELVKIVRASLKGRTRLEQHFRKDLYALASGGLADSLADFRGSLLVVSSTGDKLFPAADATRIAESATQATQKKRIIIAGAGHSDIMLKPNAYAGRIATALAKLG